MKRSGTVPDHRHMAAALALAARGRGQTAPNPNVGCILIKQGRVIGRGWTQKGGRPHAEAMALAEAGEAAHGATVYVTLEPCAHDSARGPSCADTLIEAGVARVCMGMTDPDPRTNGQGSARLSAAGIDVVTGIMASECAATMAGFLTKTAKGRPYVTLKLATSLDGMIATTAGRSRWITGEAARTHGHLERAQCDMIVVGRGTLDADAPALDVRLAGLEDRSPRRAVLSTKAVGEGWEWLPAPAAIFALSNVDHILIEGGASAAAAFMKESLVDRLLLYRAPILIGDGKPCLGDIGVIDVNDAHGRWRLVDMRMLGKDRLEIYEAQ